MQHECSSQGLASCCPAQLPEVNPSGALCQQQQQPEKSNQIQGVHAFIETFYTHVAKWSIRCRRLFC